jgi:hypothetical protein
MLNRKTVLFGAGIMVALILAVYGLAPLVLGGGSGTLAASVADGGTSAGTSAGTDKARAGGAPSSGAQADGSNGAAAGTDTPDGASPTASGSPQGGGSPGSSPGNGPGGGSGSSGSNAPVTSGSAATGSTGTPSASAGTGTGTGTGTTSPSAPVQPTCTLSISCVNILNNMDRLDPAKRGQVPSGGVIMAARTVGFTAGETVFDVLLRETRASGILMESTWTPLYNSAYIEGIDNLYEFDCGELSGWMYCVNGWYPNYGASVHTLEDGDVIQWNYTCDLGRDLGAQGVVQG